MAGSHLVFSQDPQTLPPSDSACLIPTTPFSSAPESLSTFTICQLGSLNTLHMESQPASQPAKHGDPWARPHASFSPGLGSGGEGESQFAAPLRLQAAICGLFSVNSFFQTIVGTLGVEGRGEERRCKVPVSEGEGE